MLSVIHDARFPISGKLIAKAGVELDLSDNAFLEEAPQTWHL